MAVQLQVSLKDRVGKSSQKALLWYISLSWSKKTDLSSTVIHGKWLMIWPDRQGLGRDKMEGLVKEELGEEACAWTHSMDPA